MMASMDSGFETSNDSTDSSTDMSKLLQIEFLSLIEKNACKEFNNFHNSNSFAAETNNSPANQSWKIKSKCHTNRFHNFEKLLDRNRKRRVAMSVMTNNVDALIHLLKLGKIDPNYADDHGRTPLHLAASRGYVDIVNTLIQYGANPNLKDSLGNTPLHLASCVFNKPIIKALVNGGANANILDSYNRLPRDLVLSRFKMRTKLEPVDWEEFCDVFSMLDPKKNDNEIKNLLENLKLE